MILQRLFLWARTSPVYAALAIAAIAGVAFAGWSWLQIGSVQSSKAGTGQSIGAIKALALDHHRRGDLQGFIQVLDRVPDDAPDKPRALLEQALAYRQMADGVAFEKTIANCLARERRLQSPTEATIGAWSILIDHYLMQERWDEARDLFWNLVRVAPDPVRKKHVLLRMLAPDDERYDLSEMIAWHEKFVAQNPGDADAQRALGLNLARIGRMEEARQHLGACARAHPETSRFVDSWVWFLLMAGDVEQAAEILDSLPEEFDQIDSFWMHRGRCHELRGAWSESARCFRKAVALSPHRLDANNRLAQALRITGSAREAAQQSEIAKQIAEAKRNLLNTREDLLRQNAEPDSHACARLAELCRTLGMTKEAEAWSEFE
jgi:tetratricopeptide (TPR) repeat protein